MLLGDLPSEGTNAGLMELVSSQENGLLQKEQDWPLLHLWLHVSPFVSSTFSVATVR
jgi:hypothetical protein